MGKSALLFKLMIQCYCIYTYMNSLSNRLALFIAFSLILISLDVLIPVFRSKIIQSWLVIISILSVISFQFIFPVFSLFIPVFLVEFFFIKGYSTIICIILITILLPLSGAYDITGVFFLVSGFSIILLLYFDRDIRLEALQKQNDSLRLMNDRLTRKLSLGEELKQQLTYTAQLEERNKIAQEIHDKVGHSISGSLMQLEAIKLISQSDPVRTASMLETVIGTLRGGLENIRMTLRNIKPPSEQMGINRLILMLDEFRNKHGIKTSFSYEGDISKVTPLVWKIFLENVSEGLTNLIRHSKADQVSINLYVMNKMIRLQMIDNGFVTGTIKKGLGLSGMEERLTTVGGHLIIDTSKSFSLSMLVPRSGQTFCGADGQPGFIGKQSGTQTTSPVKEDINGDATSAG